MAAFVLVASQRPLANAKELERMSSTLVSVGQVGLPQRKERSKSSSMRMELCHLRQLETAGLHKWNVLLAMTLS
jgi:hypothetical protein